MLSRYGQDGKLFLATLGIDLCPWPALSPVKDMVLSELFVSYVLLLFNSSVVCLRSDGGACLECFINLRAI